MTRIKWTDMTFTGTDVVKLGGFIAGLFTLYLNLVTELREGRSEFREHKGISEHRFAQLEKCCGITTPRVAILPKSPGIERDE